MSTDEREDSPPSEQAWARYVNSEYIDPDIIMAVRRAFLAGYGVGFSDAGGGAKTSSAR